MSTSLLTYLTHEMTRPARYECIFSLSMENEKHKCILEMKEEFQMAAEIINDFRTKWINL